MIQAGDQQKTTKCCLSQALDCGFGVTRDELNFKREEFAISLRKDKRNQNLKIKRSKLHKSKEKNNPHSELIEKVTLALRNLSQHMLCVKFSTDVVSENLKEIKDCFQNYDDDLSIFLPVIVQNCTIIDFATILDRYEQESHAVEFQDNIIDILDLL